MNKFISDAQTALSGSYTAFLSSIRNLIESLIQNPEIATAKWHPLGFVHYSLHESANIKLRLHIWPQDQRRAQVPFWPIHDHLFTLESRIISGRVTNTTYVAESSLLGEHKIYEVEYCAASSALVSTNRRVNAVVSEKIEHISGERYTVQKGVFHTSDVEVGSFASTFVIGTEVSLNKPCVLGEHSGADRYEYERVECGIEESQSLLRMLLETI